MVLNLLCSLVNPWLFSSLWLTVGGHREPQWEKLVGRNWRFWSHCICSQKADRGYTSSVCSLTRTGPYPVGGAAHVQFNLPSSIKSFWKHAHEHKEGGVSMVILNLVNNEDAPAHPGRPWTCGPLVSDSPQLALRTWTSRQGLPVSLGGTDRYFLFYLKLSVKAEFFGLHCEMWMLPYQAFHAPSRVTLAESLNF